MSEACDKGGAPSEETLQKIIENIARFSGDIWSTNHDGQSVRDLKAKKGGHSTNRWTEPPIGMSVERLRKSHLARVKVNMRHIQHLDMPVRVIPELDATDEAGTAVLEDPHGRQRRWLAKMDCTVHFKNGKVEEHPPHFYSFAEMRWVIDSDPEVAAAVFAQSLSSLPAAIRVFCLLKGECNFGCSIAWPGVETALEMAVADGMISDTDRDRLVDHINMQVKNDMRADGLLGDIKKRALDAAVAEMRSHLTLVPRQIMAILSELKIFEVSSVWADFEV